MEMTVPEANARLSSVVGQPVDIEVQWTTIFLDQFTMSQRLDVAETLAGQNSQFVIQPMVQAISTVIQKIDEAVQKVLVQGYRTTDIMSDGMTEVGTDAMGDAVIAALES